MFREVLYASVETAKTIQADVVNAWHLTMPDTTPQPPLNEFLATWQETKEWFPHGEPLSFDEIGIRGLYCFNTLRRNQQSRIVHFRAFKEKMHEFAMGHVQQ